MFHQMRYNFQLVLFLLLCLLFQNLLSFRWRAQFRAPISNVAFKRTIVRFTNLSAKKKSNRLISEDLLASIDLFDDDDTHTEVKSPPAPKNDKLLRKITDNVEINGEVVHQHQRKETLVNVEILNSCEKPLADQYQTAKEAAPHNDTVQDDVTPKAPGRSFSTRSSSNIRLSDNAQQDYVMMGLNKVQVVFGDNVVLRDASFSACTGERVGLVGPNGGGKVRQHNDAVSLRVLNTSLLLLWQSTLLKVLSGEIAPSYGEVLKSAKSLRVAYLRQEFADELDPLNTLQSELRRAFTDELAVLQEIAECEEQVQHTVHDPRRMEQVLDRLHALREQAIAQGCYALDAKVLRIMHLTGFSAEEDSEKLVRDFSGGWKMRVGLAKILLREP